MVIFCAFGLIQSVSAKYSFWAPYRSNFPFKGFSLPIPFNRVWLQDKAIIALSTFSYLLDAFCFAC